MHVPSCDFAAGLEKGQEPPAAISESVSPRTVRSTRRGQPAVMTSSPAAQARTRWTSRLVKPRERAACSQLVLFHRIYEQVALGMHPATQYPRRIRFAPILCAC